MSYQHPVVGRQSWGVRIQDGLMGLTFLLESFFRDGCGWIHILFEVSANNLPPSIISFKDTSLSPLLSLILASQQFWHGMGCCIFFQISDLKLMLLWEPLEDFLAYLKEKPPDIWNHFGVEWAASGVSGLLLPLLAIFRQELDATCLGGHRADSCLGTS